MFLNARGTRVLFCVSAPAGMYVFGKWKYEILPKEYDG
jgi:hypothetical protein